MKSTTEPSSELSKPLRVVLAHNNAEIAADLKRSFEQLCHELVGFTDTGKELTSMCDELDPDLILASVKLRDGGGIDTLIECSNRKPRPSIIVADHDDLADVEHACEDHVMAYLVEPVNHHLLKTSIHLVMHRFEQFEELKQGYETLEEALNDRKVVEKAKGILMKKHDVDENTAYQALRKKATDERKKMKEIAAVIVEAENIMKDIDL